MKTIITTILLFAGITSTFTQVAKNEWIDAANDIQSQWEKEGYTKAGENESQAVYLGKVFRHGGYVYAWKYQVGKKAEYQEGGLPLFSVITLLVCDCELNRSTIVQETVYDIGGKVLNTEESEFYSGSLTFAIPNSLTDKFIEASCAKADEQLKPDPHADAEAKKQADYEKSKEQFGSILSGTGKGDPDASILEGISTGTGVVGGGLSNRGVLYEPKVNDSSQKTGRVVVNVCVDKSGKVISAIYTQRGSTTTDSDLRALAERSARKFRFSQCEVDKQCGTVTIDFKVQD